MTAVVTSVSIRGAARYRAWCDTCTDGLERTKRPPVKAWADDHNRIYHPAPGQPDSNPRTEARFTVQDTPEWDHPRFGSVQILTRRGNFTSVEQMTWAEALDLQRHLNHYLKGGKK